MKDMFETFAVLATNHAIDFEAKLRILAEVVADPEASPADLAWAQGEAIGVRDKFTELCNAAIVAAQQNQVAANLATAE